MWLFIPPLIVYLESQEWGNAIAKSGKTLNQKINISLSYKGNLVFKFIGILWLVYIYSKYINI